MHKMGCVIHIVLVDNTEISYQTPFLTILTQSQSAQEEGKKYVELWTSP